MIEESSYGLSILTTNVLVYIYLFLFMLSSLVWLEINIVEHRNDSSSSLLSGYDRRNRSLTIK